MRVGEIRARDKIEIIINFDAGALDLVGTGIKMLNGFRTQREENEATTDTRRMKTLVSLFSRLTNGAVAESWLVRGYRGTKGKPNHN